MSKSGNDDPEEVRQRDELWKVSYEAFYDSSYGEILLDKLMRRWSVLDFSSRLAVALTSSGSGVAGWVLWSEPGSRKAWSVIAGVAALLAIVHSVLNTTKRLEDINNSRDYFLLLRNDLQSFRQQMAIFPKFSVPEFYERRVQFRERLKEAERRLKDDFLITMKLRQGAQDEIDEQLRSDNIE